jgi:hypothetical protein
MSTMILAIRLYSPPPPPKVDLYTRPLSAAWREYSVVQLFTRQIQTRPRLISGPGIAGATLVFVAGFERTTYPRFKRNPTRRELEEVYSPTNEQLALATDNARDDTHRLHLLLWLPELSASF